MLVFAENFGTMSPFTAAQQHTPASIGYTANNINSSGIGERLIYSGGIPGYNFFDVACDDDFAPPGNNSGLHHTFDTNLVFFGKGAGRMSKNAIMVRSQDGAYRWWGSSPIFGKTKRVVVGMWIGPVAPGFSNVCVHPSCLMLNCQEENWFTGDASGSNERATVGHASNGVNKFVFMFTSANLMDWYTRSDFYDTRYLYSTDATPMKHMTVTCNLVGSDAWTVSVKTHSQTGYVYDTVPASSVSYQDASRPFFLEVLIDSEDAVTGHGIVKVAVNGHVIATFNNLYTLDVQRLAGDMLQPNAYYRQVFFGIGPDDYPYRCTAWQVDGFYICDGSAGYQNDFLGPVMISTVYPVEDTSINEWSTVLDGAHGEFDHHECVDLEYYCRRTFDEVTYIEADQHNMREMMKFDFPFDVRNTAIKAVQFNGVFEKQYSFAYGAAPRVYSTIRISGHEASDTDSFTYLPADNMHRCLTSPLGIAPTLATPWTWELLQNAEFGFTYYDGAWYDVVCTYDSNQGFVNQSSASTTGTELFDGNPSTYITSNCSSCRLILGVPAGKIVDRIEVTHGSGSPTDIHGYLSVSGDYGNSWIMLGSRSFTLAGAGYGIAPAGAYLAIYDIDVPYPITNILLGAYGYACYWDTIYYSVRVLGAQKA